MSSQRRIDSSRANGAKSRGPVTAEGKRKSSANSLRHGLLAQCIVLEDEVPERFHELLADLTREHNPQTETQLGLVETMAMARWRVMRPLSLRARSHRRGNRPNAPRPERTVLPPAPVLPSARSAITAASSSYSTATRPVSTSNTPAPSTYS